MLEALAITVAQFAFASVAAGLMASLIADPVSLLKQVGYGIASLWGRIKAYLEGVLK